MTSARERADEIVDAIAQSGVSLGDAQWDSAVDAIAAALLTEREAGRAEGREAGIEEAARRRGIDDVTRLAITCGNADWDGEKVCPTCGGKGYVDGE